MTALYNTIGIGYDDTRKADPYIVERFLNLLQPELGKRYLDIGCGTGNYTSALQRGGYDFIGVDPSAAMLEAAGQKNPDVDWRIGSAEATGLDAESVDGIVASLTLHHWSDLEAGFREMYRVLKRGGTMVIFSTTPEQTGGYWLHHYFPKMMEDSVQQLPSFERVEAGLLSVGFTSIETEKYFVQPDLKDMFLYSGKHNPELYFRPDVRSGISSFAAFSNREEVERGLGRLREDIESGKVQEVVDRWENDLGDYLFITARSV
ncbi:MAG: class I SAM-dependent methyltransferase [Candidatus Kapaibacterium sp.]